LTSFNNAQRNIESILESATDSVCKLDKLYLDSKITIKSQLKNLDSIAQDEIINDLLSLNVNKQKEAISNYDVAFYLLSIENKELEQNINNQKEILSMEVFEKVEFSIARTLTFNILTLELPEFESSIWRLVFRTIFENSGQAGPILSLTFEGWSIISYTIIWGKL
jgi:hypothetical protein